MPRRRRGARAVAVEAERRARSGDAHPAAQPEGHGRGRCWPLPRSAPSSPTRCSCRRAAIRRRCSARWSRCRRRRLAPASPLPRPRPVEADAVEPLEPSLPKPKPVEKPAEPKPRIRWPIWSRRPSSASCGACQCRCGRRRRSRCLPATRRSMPDRRRAPRGGGAARADRIWLRPVEADRHGRLRHPGRDPEIRARAQDPGDRADVRSAGARTRRR